jgi:cytochrome c oxidase subunit 3
MMTTTNHHAADRIRQTGIWIFLGAVTMLFAALISAMTVRSAMGDWGGGVPLPSALWASTGILAASSVVLELRRGSAWWAGGLGAGFLAAQAWAWSQLLRSGVDIGSSPGASFFYVFTAVHGLHALGGVVALLPWSGKAARIYWHYLAGLWLLLLTLFQTT